MLIHSHMFRETRSHVGLVSQAYVQRSCEVTMPATKGPSDRMVPAHHPPCDYNDWPTTALLVLHMSLAQEQSRVHQHCVNEER